MHVTCAGFRRFREPETRRGVRWSYQAIDVLVDSLRKLSHAVRSAFAEPEGIG
jgi:hypothetical protein